MVDLTINTRPRTIRLGQPGVRLEKPAGGAINPGHLVQLGSNDKFTVHNIAGKRAARIWALENELIGKDIDTAYASNDLCQAEHFDSGDWVLAKLAANATAVLEGDKLESAGDGTLRKTTADYEDFIA